MFVKVFRVSSTSYDTRVASVVSLDGMILDYVFDRVDEEWCILSIRVSVNVKR
jgi:hypothetical protein